MNGGGGLRSSKRFAQENPRETRICDGEMRMVATRSTTPSEADGMVDEMTGGMGLTASRTEIGRVMAAVRV